MPRLAGRLEQVHITLLRIGTLCMASSRQRSIIPCSSNGVTGFSTKSFKRKCLPERTISEIRRRLTRGVHGIELWQRWLEAALVVGIQRTHTSPLTVGLHRIPGFCATYNGTSGAVATMRAALLHLCRVNAWDKAPFTSGISLIPGQALMRLNRHQTKKSEGLTLEMVTHIFHVYCFKRSSRPSHGQWELAIGVAIVVSFKVFARWDDARQLRWDVNYFEITDIYVRFYLEHRKNAQYNGNYVDIAIPAAGERGAYHVIRDAYHVFRNGHVLPYIDSSGSVDTSRHMPYDTYVMHLRRALVHIGVPEEQSRRFAGQSARAGAATTAARAGMQPYELCRLAGVTSINWALAYMRPDFNDRMQASRAVGL